jgi:hypothetical protein
MFTRQFPTLHRCRQLAGNLTLAFLPSLMRVTETERRAAASQVAKEIKRRMKDHSAPRCEFICNKRGNAKKGG